MIPPTPVPLSSSDALRSVPFTPMCRNSSTPLIRLAYPLHVNALATFGVLAVSVDYLIGIVKTATIRLIPKSGGQTVSLTAVQDSRADGPLQTLHTLVPKLNPGEYVVHVTLHDKAIHCGLGEDEATVESIQVERLLPVDSAPPTASPP